MSRTEEDINRVLSVAKLNKADLLPTCQAISFSENFGATDYKLLQLNPHLTECLRLGETLHINGDRDDDIFICTDDRTYEVLNVETSNNLLLIENLRYPDELQNNQQPVSAVCVDEIFKECVEVTQRKPSLQKVNALLQNATFKGTEFEFEIDSGNLLTFNELWSKVPISKKELQSVLNNMQVIVLEEKLRVLDFEYHFRVLSYMLKLIEENSWQLDEIDYDETINSLSDLIPEQVLRSLFELYTEESKLIDGLQLYKYKEAEVCRFFAQVLLHSAGKFNLREFLQAWQESVPEGMETDEEMLYGIAVIDRKSVPGVIWAFSESRLPENLNERFKILFEMKEKWSVPEISPYIQRLTKDKLDVNALLAKHARASKVDGVKYYSSKHGK